MPEKSVNLRVRKMKESFPFSYLFLFSIFLFQGCVNDMEEVKAITEEELLPIEVSENIKIIYSDSAQLRVIVEAGHLERFQGDNPYLEMSNGVYIRFFSGGNVVESELTSNYAISYQNSDIMEAKEDVVVINQKGETLNTEHLIWEKKTEKIYTEEFVKITTEDEVIFGHGFESNQDFSKYKVKKIKGTINIKEKDAAADSIPESNRFSVF